MRDFGSWRNSASLFPYPTNYQRLQSQPSSFYGLAVDWMTKLPLAIMHEIPENTFLIAGGCKIFEYFKSTGHFIERLSSTGVNCFWNFESFSAELIYLNFAAFARILGLPEIKSRSRFATLHRLLLWLALCWPAVSSFLTKWFQTSLIKDFWHTQKIHSQNILQRHMFDFPIWQLSYFLNQVKKKVLEAIS